MAFFNLDWARLATEVVPGWHRVDPTSQLEFMSRDWRHTSHARDWFRDGEPLIELGLLKSTNQRGGLSHTPELGRPFAQLLNAGSLAEAQEPGWLMRQLMLQTGAVLRASIGDEVAGIGTVRRFLALRNKQQAQAFIEGGEGRPPHPLRSLRKKADVAWPDLLNASDRKAAQAVVRRAVDAGSIRIPMLRALAEDDAELLNQGLALALRWGVLIGCGRRQEHEFEIDMHPLTRAALKIEQTPPPEPVGGETSTPGWLMEDLTTLVLAASSEPPRLKAGSAQVSLYVADQKRLVNLLPAVDVPEPLTDHLRLASARPPRRLAQAVELALTSELLRANKTGKSHTLELKEDAAAWIARPPQSRLHWARYMLRPFAFDDAPTRRQGPLRWLPYTLSWDRALRMLLTHHPDAGLEWVARTLEPEAGPVSETDQPPARRLVPLVWQAVREGDLLKSLMRSLPATKGANAYVDRELRQMLQPLGEPALQHQAWLAVVGHVLRGLLVPLGGVDLVAGGDSDLLDSLGPALRLNAVGRYLLGRTEALTADQVTSIGVGAERPVLYQPNFEVVFLEPSPAAELTLGTLAERLDAPSPERVGSLYRLTAEGVTRAVARGLEPDEVLTRLRELSEKPLPRNVEAEVQRWADRTFRVTAEPTLLMRCPDRGQRDRLRAALGKHAQPAGEASVTLAKRHLTAAARAKALKAGIVIERPEA